MITSGFGFLFPRPSFVFIGGSVRALRGAPASQASLKIPKARGMQPAPLTLKLPGLLRMPLFDFPSGETQVYSGLGQGEKEGDVIHIRNKISSYSSLGLAK